MLILFILVWGLAIGWVAQFVVFGAGRPTALALFAGLAGSFVGGLLISLLSGDGLDLKASGIIGSIVGAIIVLFVVKLVRDRAAKS
jgi:uncharacterized membrane protein YeaQ/YmgE (transglycosylase-associated protein family)